MKLHTTKQLSGEEQEREIANAIIKAKDECLMHIGRELHDNVNQLLVSAKLYIAMAKPSEATQPHIDKGLALLREAIMQIQFLSRGMATPKLPGTALIANIEALVEHLKETTELEIFFIHSLTGRQLSGAKGLALFRIVQEQVKNVLAHSRATTLTVTLSSDTDEITLSMQDNGVGMKEDSPKSGIGLANIEQRVKAFNGKATIYTQPGMGYRMEVVIPRRLYG